MPWNVAQTEPRKEQYAALWLNRSGFQTYLPMHQASFRAAPLFPGYLMVQACTFWAEARWSPGVAGILMSAGCPARLPDEAVDRTRQQERNGLVILPPAPGLHVGDRVRIRHGAFAGHLAIFQGMATQERVHVLLRLLGQQVKVCLRSGEVEAVTVAGKRKSV